jgi:hypothetical protein
MREKRDHLSSHAIFGWGLLLPVASLIAFDVALGEASRGTGGFEAAWLVIVGVFIVPGMFVANCWLFFVRWSGRAKLFLAGLVLPGLMGTVQAVLLYGNRDVGRWVNGLLSRLPWLQWAFLAMFLVPLATLALRSLVRRRMVHLSSRGMRDDAGRR